MSLIKANHTCFKNTFFSSTIIEWKKLDSNICCSPSYKPFRKWILEFIRYQLNSIFNIFNSSGLTYLTRRVHLPEHQLRHNFRNSLNAVSNCTNTIESKKHYLLHCLNFKIERQTLLQNVRNVNPNLLSMNKKCIHSLIITWGQYFKR